MQVTVRQRPGGAATPWRCRNALAGGRRVVKLPAGTSF
jgi:hypothetical protein